MEIGVRKVGMWPGSVMLGCWSHNLKVARLTCGRSALTWQP